ATSAAVQDAGRLLPVSSCQWKHCIMGRSACTRRNCLINGPLVMLSTGLSGSQWDYLQPPDQLVFELKDDAEKMCLCASLLHLRLFVTSIRTERCPRLTLSHKIKVLQEAIKAANCAGTRRKPRHGKCAAAAQHKLQGSTQQFGEFSAPNGESRRSCNHGRSMDQQRILEEKKGAAQPVS
ncbi:unnamed protein product, partial [Pleuronectes platessa]